MRKSAILGAASNHPPCKNTGCDRTPHIAAALMGISTPEGKRAENSTMTMKGQRKSGRVRGRRELLYSISRARLWAREWKSLSHWCVSVVRMKSPSHLHCMRGTPEGSFLVTWTIVKMNDSLAPLLTEFQAERLIGYASNEHHHLKSLSFDPLFIPSQGMGHTIRDRIGVGL